MIGWIVVIVACTVLCCSSWGKGRPKVVPRLIALAAVVAVGAVELFYVYLDDDRYNALAGDHAQKGGGGLRRHRGGLPLPPTAWGTIWRPMPPMTPARPRPSSASTRTG